MQFFSRPRHSMAVERRPVDYLPAFGFFRLPRGVPRILLSETYQSSSQRSIPSTVKSSSSTLTPPPPPKEDLLNCWTSSSDMSRRTQHCRSMAGASHGTCELTARHAMCESAFSVSKLYFEHTVVGVIGIIICCMYLTFICPIKRNCTIW